MTRYHLFGWDSYESERYIDSFDDEETARNFASNDTNKFDFYGLYIDFGSGQMNRDQWAERKAGKVHWHNKQQL